MEAIPLCDIMEVYIYIYLYLFIYIFTCIHNNIPQYIYVYIFIELLPIYNLLPYLGAVRKCVEGVDMWGEVIH